MTRNEHTDAAGVAPGHAGAPAQHGHAGTGARHHPGTSAAQGDEGARVQRAGAAALASPLATYQGVVYPWHCDHVGHMNVMWYVGKFDEATWFLFNRIGLTRGLLAAEGRGMAAVEQRIAYQQELIAGDAIAVETTMLEVRPRVLRFAHRMTLAESGDTAALMMQTTVYLDMHRRKAVALPEPVRRHAEAMLGTLVLPWDAR